MHGAVSTKLRLFQSITHSTLSYNFPKIRGITSDACSIRKTHYIPGDNLWLSFTKTESLSDNIIWCEIKGTNSNTEDTVGYDSRQSDVVRFYEYWTYSCGIRKTWCSIAKHESYMLDTIRHSNVSHGKTVPLNAAVYGGNGADPRQNNDTISG